MKLLILSLLFVSCNDNATHSATHKNNECKIVEQIGGCNKYFCGVKFEDGTFTSYAEAPAVGATMCKTRHRGLWLIEE
jgi:hypothetical protein